MKKILLSFCTFILLSVSAQTPCGESSPGWNLVKENFYARLIFTDTARTDSARLAGNVYEMLKTTTGITDLHMLNGSFAFRVVGHTVDYKKLGYTWHALPNLLKYRMDFDAYIDVKNGKYQLTVSNFVSHLSDSSGGSKYIWSREIFNQDGCLRRGLLKTLVILRDDAQNMFQLKSIKNTSDW